MKTLLSNFTLFLIILTKTAFAQNGLQEVDWKNNSVSPIKLNYNKNIDAPFMILNLTINNVGQNVIDSVLVECSNPNITSKFIHVEDTVDNNGKIVFDLGSYIRESFSGEFVQLKKLPEKTNIKITLKSATENMIFDMEVSAKSGSQVSGNLVFQFNPPALPRFSTDIEPSKNNKHRILLLDGTGNLQANNGFELYSFRNKWLGDNEYHKVRVKSLIVNRSLSVFTSDINLDSLQSITFSLNGTDYSYNAGVTEIYGKIPAEKEKGKEESDEVALEDKSIQSDSLKQLIRIKTYLKAANSRLSENLYFNIIDHKRLQAYKVQLKKSIDEPHVALDEESLGHYFQIMNFQPKYVNLTPIALTVPNADEVEVESTLKFGKNGVEEKYTTGIFRSSRSLAVHVGSSLFITGLKNNNVYTETVHVGDSEELRAKIDEDNQLSLGIGVNSEVSYRTGGMLRPTVNLAFFVPFAEEITPFVGLGGGFSFYDKNVSLNLSGGWAFGKVNSISEQYRDRDLTAITDLTNTSLIQKVWKRDWYFSIGIGFNIKAEK